MDTLSALADTPRQNFSRNSLDRLLAGRINIQNEQRISVCKRSNEFLHQIARTRVAMRLEDNVNLAESTLLRSRKRSPDLRRMMPIIVDHTDSRRLPAQLKAPVDPAEFIERTTNRLDLDIQPHTHRD